MVAEIFLHMLSQSVLVGDHMLFRFGRDAIFTGFVVVGRDEPPRFGPAYVNRMRLTVRFAFVAATAHCGVGS